MLPLLASRAFLGPLPCISVCLLGPVRADAEPPAGGALTVAPWGGFEGYFNARRGAATLEVNRWITAQRGAIVDPVVDAHGLLACAADGPTHLWDPVEQSFANRTLGRTACT